jgi:hypothetical protein
VALRRDARVRSYKPALVLLAVLAIVHVFIATLAFTGDEPRYVSQGVALASAGHLQPSAALWDAFLARSHLALADYPYAATAYPAPALGPSIVFGPLLILGGLGVARWFAFAIGCLGIVTLYRTLLLVTDGGPHRAAALALAFSCLSLPLLAYLRLLYPEVLLFAAISGASYGLIASRRSPVALLAGLLPLVHVRAFPLSVAFFALLMWDMLQANGRRSDALRLTAIYCAGLALWLVAARAAFGSAFGAAFPSYTPSLAGLPGRLGMQLFDVRHGLLAYSPIFIVGIAGLMAGVALRRRACMYAALLLATYLATFVWSTASESYTARFWVAAIPFLAIGLTDWLKRISLWAQWLPVATCAALTTVNLALFCREPAWFLENRRASVSYAELFSLSHVHLGLYLPIDGAPEGLPLYGTPLTSLSLFALALVLGLILCQVLPGRLPRLLFACSAFAITLVPFVVGAQRVLPASAYALHTSSNGDGVTLDLDAGATGASALQLDAKLPLLWTPATYPRAFDVRCRAGERELGASTQPSRPIILLPGCGAATSILITAVPRSSGPSVFASLGAVKLLRPLLR